MKQIFFLLLFSSSVSAQKFVEKSDSIETTFSYILKVDSTILKQDLYNQFRVNIERAYMKGLRPPEVESQTDGKLFAQCQSGRLVYNNGIKMFGGTFDYSLYVVCRDGKSKITVSDIRYSKGEMTQMKSGTPFADIQPSNWLYNPGLIDPSESGNN